MQAIQVKYFGPTYKRGTRIKAIANAGSITVSRHGPLDEMIIEKAMCKVAEQLARKFKWTGTYVGHTLPGGDMVFSPAESFDTFTIEKENS